VGLVYFTDRDLGQRFPDILESAGLEVERHHSHFADDAPDIESKKRRPVERVELWSG
jgi:hypothetical protein